MLYFLSASLFSSLLCGWMIRSQKIWDEEVWNEKRGLCPAVGDTMIANKKRISRSFRSAKIISAYIHPHFLILYLPPPDNLIEKLPNHVLFIQQYMYPWSMSYYNLPTGRMQSRYNFMGSHNLLAVPTSAHGCKRSLWEHKLYSISVPSHRKP